MATAWSFLTLEEADRTYTGNEGYADQLDSHYVFDTTVPNHGRVARGDLAVLRDSDVILGVGWIDSVDESSGEKIRQRCPECTRTGFKRRKHLTPTFKCANCRTEFDEPTKERLDIRRFIADCSRTFAAVDSVVMAYDLAPAYRSQAVQHAIRELDLGQVREIVGPRTMKGQAYWAPDGYVRPTVPGGFNERLGKVRIGQQRFREQLIEKFGEVCAFTGPQPAAALDAAHLYRYSERPQHETDCGLLLRRDLHGLFDRWLITIDPDTWRVQVAPELTRYTELARLDDAPLRIPDSVRPRRDHLEVHFSMARSGW